MFVAFDVFLHVKTKVATVFAKLPIHRSRLVARICGFCVDRTKMTNANNKQMMTELSLDDIDSLSLSLPSSLLLPPSLSLFSFCFALLFSFAVLQKHFWTRRHRWRANINVIFTRYIDVHKLIYAYTADKCDTMKVDRQVKFPFL